MMNSQRCLLAIFIICSACLLGAKIVCADEALRYEYKIVSLGSLSALQNKDKADAAQQEVERILNREGKDGWELVNIFAVRTTFDPNVFFASMKRLLPSKETGYEAP